MIHDSTQNKSKVEAALKSAIADPVNWNYVEKYMREELDRPVSTEFVHRCQIRHSNKSIVYTDGYYMCYYCLEIYDHEV